VKLYPDRLSGALAPGGLLSVYLVSGDEPLQHGECCDAIRSAAKDAGHTTREVIEVGSGFDWQRLALEAASVSLFAEKKLIDLRLPNGKPGTEGGKALAAYCAAPPPDTLLLLSLPRIDRQQKNSKWFKAIDQAGAIIEVWPVDAQRLPAWIEQRLGQAGITPTREAVRLLADRVEGNLLAARQEIDKLALLHGPGPLDGEQMSAAVADSARYDPFDLVDSALRGEASRCVHILQGLRGEGVPAARVLWALHREVRQLARIAADVARGRSIEHALSRTRVMPRRSGLVRQGVARLRAGQWLGLLDTCRSIDRAIKGLEPSQPWLLLEELVLAIGGNPSPRRPIR
jgi:DNA polymerase-3 subunit delta